MPDIKISVRTLDRGQFSYELPPNTTVGGLKERLASDSEYPADRLRLLHRGRELTQDSQSLAQLNLPENVVLHCAIRAAPAENQRRAPTTAGTNATGGAGQGGGQPFVFGGAPPGVPGNMTPGNFMQFMQGPGGIGGILGSISIETPGTVSGNMGTTGGPTAEQLARIQESVAQMFGGNAGGVGGPTVTVTGGTNTTAGGQRAGGQRGGQRNTPGPARGGGGAHVAPMAGYGGMPFVYPFGSNGQPVPGLSSETAARGGDPFVDSNGQYNQRSVLEGLDELLLRLQNGNMSRDPGPPLLNARRDSIGPGSENAWAQAALAFLRSCRTILSNASLNRETLAAVNRIFSAAGLRPLALGVRSFPLHGVDDEEENEGVNIRGSEGQVEEQEEDEDRLPELVDVSFDGGSRGEDDDEEEEEYSDEDEDSHVYTSDESWDDEDDEDDYDDEDEEEDSDYSNDGNILRQGLPPEIFHRLFGSENDDDDDDSEEMYSDKDETSQWETDKGDDDDSLPELVGDDSGKSRSSSPPPLLSDGEEEQTHRQARSVPLAARATGRGSDGGSGSSSPPPLISDGEDEAPVPRATAAAAAATRGGGRGGRGGRGRGGQQQQQQPRRVGPGASLAAALAAAAANNNSDEESEVVDNSNPDGEDISEIESALEQAFLEAVNMLPPEIRAVAAQAVSETESRHQSHLVEAAIAEARREGRDPAVAATEAIRNDTENSAAFQEFVSGLVGSDSEGDGSGTSSPPPLVSDADEEELQPRAVPITTRATRGAAGHGRGHGRSQQQQQQQQRASGGRGSILGASFAATVAAAVAGASNDSEISDSDESMPELLSDEEEPDYEAIENRRTVRRRTNGAPASGSGTAAATTGTGTNATPSGAGATRAAADSAAWFRAMPGDDLILVAAITVGELARRFMSILGQENAPVQVNAMIMRLATRLRSLSSLEGIGRMELARQISLVGGHLQRMAATAAELGRIMEYVHSALAMNNMYFLQMLPGYITYDDENRAISNLSIIRSGPNAADIIGGGFVPGPGGSHGVAGMVGVSINGVPGQAQVRILPVNLGGGGSGGGGNSGPATAAAAAAAAPSAATATPTSSFPPSTAGENPTPPASFASLSAVARHVVNSTVQDLPSLIREIAAAVTGTVTNAINESNRAQQTQNTTIGSGSGSASLGSASAIASRAAGVVDDVVRRHLAQIVNAPEMEQHSQQVRDLLGVDVVDLLRNLSRPSGNQQQQGQQEEPRREEQEQQGQQRQHPSSGLSAAAPAFVPNASAPVAQPAQAEDEEAATAAEEENRDVAGEVRRFWDRRLERQAGENAPVDATTSAAGTSKPEEKKLEEEKKPAAPQEEKQQASTSAAAAAPAAARRSAGPALPPRPGSRATGGGPSLPSRRAGAAPTPAASTPAPAATAPAAGARGLPASLNAALSGAASGGGGGGGLRGMLQSMMSNPAIGEIARSPSMQQAASQLLGGSGGAGGASGGGAGGGLNIGALMNSAGPMLSQLMGGMAAPPPSSSSSQPARAGAGTAGGGASAAAGRARPTPTASASSGGDLDAQLGSALSPEDATRWKTILQADDDTAQKAAAAAGGAQQDGMGFSDAYYAAMPPRAANGLLQGLLGGQD